MCFSNCPYERWSGECSGKGKLNKGQPHCAEEDEYEEALEAREEDLIARADYAEDMRING